MHNIKLFADKLSWPTFKIIGKFHVHFLNMHGDQYVIYEGQNNSKFQSAKTFILKVFWHWLNWQVFLKFYYFCLSTIHYLDVWKCTWLLFFRYKYQKGTLTIQTFMIVFVQKCRIIFSDHHYHSKRLLCHAILCIATRSNWWSSE